VPGVRLPEVGEFAQTQFMAAMLTPPLRLAGLGGPVGDCRCLGSRPETRCAVLWLQRLRDRRAADDSWTVRLVFRRPGRGLISGLVYPGAWGSIAGHRVTLTTPDDEHGRAETVIPAPEKRKVGSSILPLTTI
jgi:hypothetical protein